MEQAPELRPPHQAHVSDSHSEWWSVVRYVTQPSQKKARNEIDAEPALYGIKADELFRASQRPFNAQSWKKVYEKEAADAQAKKEKVPNLCVHFLTQEINSQI